MQMLASEPRDRARGTAVLVHGFGRRPEHLDDLATRLSGLGARVLRPSLSAWWWPTCTNNTRYLDRVARAVTGPCGEGPIVVVGHSAGAAAGAWVAARLVEVGRDVRTLVFVDGVESPVRAISRSWPVLQAIPVVAICGDPRPCNRNGALERWLRDRQHDADPRLQIVSVAGMGHGDVEGTGVGIYVRVCGDDPAAPQREVLMDLIVGTVSRAWGAPAN